jgi:hypothetical protein
VLRRVWRVTLLMLSLWGGIRHWQYIRYEHVRLAERVEQRALARVGVAEIATMGMAARRRLRR